MGPRNIYVVPGQNGWAVKQEGSPLPFFPLLTRRNLPLFRPPSPFCSNAPRRTDHSSPRWSNSRQGSFRRRSALSARFSTLIDRLFPAHF